MTGLKHNPYVGTFFNVNYQLEEPGTPNALANSRNNPLVGTFRHSPSVISKNLGLKVGVMYNGTAGLPPIISRLQAAKDNSSSLGLSRRNFITSLRQIPVTRFSTMSIGSRSSVSSLALDPIVGSNPSPSGTECGDSPRNSRQPTALDAALDTAPNAAPNAASDDAPVCAICLEVYADGDEILTLACSHCFHSECASRWFFQQCLNSADISSAFSCPQCRQDHVALSEVSSQANSVLPEGSVQTSTEIDAIMPSTSGIAAQSFLCLGQSLLSGGYDFLSDISSEGAPSVKKSQLVVSSSSTPPTTPTGTPANQANLDASTWSDCGMPLPSQLSPLRRK